MSVYGTVKRQSRQAPSTVWTLQSEPRVTQVTIHHLTLEDAKGLDGLLDYLCAVFTAEVEAGMTYPQDTMDTLTFETYFFAADVLVAISVKDIFPPDSGKIADDTPVTQLRFTSISITEARAGRSWEECVSGFYYVKPNYPGRSSHICNGGFVVPPLGRGRGVGRILADSYLYYAPKLGYQASVFNLVYVNNTASIRLWERLGFTKAGLIPKAGRLKKKDGSGEEYVDAWVFYKSFEDDTA